MRLVFDIDDTILFCDKEYKIKYCDHKMVGSINELHSKGHIIIIWTGRHWDKLQHTENQLKEIGLKYNTLLMAKPTADYYIDDKSIKPGEFNELYQSVK